MLIRNATIEDLPQMKYVYADTIRTVCRHDYTEEETEMWASSVNKEERWLDMMLNQVVLIAEIEGIISGFGTLKDRCYIDFFYVHKDFQRQGIAKELLKMLLHEGITCNAKFITSDISITARPFFEKNGFKVVAEQQNIRQDQVLINYKMIRHLPGPGLNSSLKAIVVIEHIFKITGRGLVFTGMFIEGDFSAGDVIEFYACNTLKKRKILGRDMIRFAEYNPLKFGMLIRCKNEQEIDELRAMPVFNLIASIYSSEISDGEIQA